jgi:hypothetical protein
MTPEELLKVVREEMKNASSEQGAVVAAAAMKAVSDYMGRAFGGQLLDKVLSPGEQFAADPQVKDFVSTRAKNTAPIAVQLRGYGLKAGEYIPARLKTNVLATDYPSERTYLPPAIPPQRTFRLRDLIPVAGLATPQIEYARIITLGNSAGGVAEGNAKPESAIQTQIITQAVVTIATFIPATRQALRDVQGLAAYINQVLGYFLQLEEDDQILNGAGGNDMTGIYNTTGTQTQAFSNDIIETVRKAVTKIQTAFMSDEQASGFDPTGVVFHPNDWETAELIKDLNDRYILIPDNRSPADSVPARLWSIPVIVTPANSAGNALMGAFDIGATLWTYEALTLRTSDSHSDWFTKNIVAILAEFRELLAVYFPAAFVEVDVVA